MNVAFIGNLGSGKTTAANFYVSKANYIKWSLADPMRWMASEIFGIKDKTDPRYRGIMLKIGDWCRSIDPDVFVKHLYRRVKTETDIHPIVVDDVRFMNEAKAILDWGWTLIYLDCPEEIRRARCLSRDGNFDETALTHPSETGIARVVEELKDDIIFIDSSEDLDSVQAQLEDIFNYCNLSKKLHNVQGPLGFNPFFHRDNPGCVKK